MLLLAVFVIIDGLAGPRMSSMNLAGVLPWTHWRGLAVLVLLFGGNLLCMACPFTLPRSLAGRFLPRKLVFPRFLRTKWLAVLLLLIWLWAARCLCSGTLRGRPPGSSSGTSCRRSWWMPSPRGLLRKHVCPIGQFHFVQSMVSPMQVSARDASVCAECTTHECIRIRVPKAVGVISSCPGRSAISTARSVWTVPMPARRTMSVSREARRADLSFMGWRSSLGSLVERAMSALCCSSSSSAHRQRLRHDHPGDRVPGRMVGSARSIVSFPDGHFFLLCSYRCFQLSPCSGSWSACVLVVVRRERSWLGRRGVLSLVPLGAAMWIVHYQFHLMTSWLTILPVAQRALLDHRSALLPVIGEPVWSQACCLPQTGCSCSS